MNALEKIKLTMMKKFAISPQVFDKNEDFASMGISSVQIANLLFEIETTFGVKIDFNEISFLDVDSPQKVADYIEKAA